MMIQLTQLKGEVVWVASSAIVAVRPAQSFEVGGTHIEFDDGHFYTVQESVEQVISAIYAAEDPHGRRTK